MVSDINGKGYLFRAFEAASKRLVALFDVARDVFDHDDGVVDHKPRGNGQGMSVRLLRLKWSRCMTQARANRTAMLGMIVAANVRRKRYHHDDQATASMSFELHVAHRGLNGGGPVRKNGNGHTRGQCRPELGQQFFMCRRRLKERLALDDDTPAVYRHIQASHGANCHSGRRHI